MAFTALSIHGKGDVERLQQAAIKSLRRLRGSVVVDSAAEQVNEILAELSSVGEDKEATLGELFQGKCLKALTIAGGLVLLQQVGAFRFIKCPLGERMIAKYMYMSIFEMADNWATKCTLLCTINTSGFSSHL